jgi:hypothetical protein
MRFYWRVNYILTDLLTFLQSTLVVIVAEGLCYFFDDLTGTSIPNISVLQIAPTFVEIIPCNVCIATIADIGTI